MSEQPINRITLMTRFQIEWAGFPFRGVRGEREPIFITTP